MVFMADAFAVRNNFNAICDHPGAYDSVRRTIKDRTYWEIEEAHFRNVNNLILDHNYREVTAKRLADAI